MSLVEERALQLAEVIDLAATPELEERRMKALTLRLRRFTSAQIATALGVDLKTITADLHWIATQRKALFGMPAKMEVEQEIGEALDVYRDAEVHALRDYNKHDASDARARNACLRTAILARTARIHLLQDLGFVDRVMGTIGVKLNADSIRQALRDEGLLLPDRKSSLAGELAEDKDEDEVVRWLAGGGR